VVENYHRIVEAEKNIGQFQIIFYIKWDRFAQTNRIVGQIPDAASAEPRQVGQGHRTISCRDGLKSLQGPFRERPLLSLLNDDTASPGALYQTERIAAQEGISTDDFSTLYRLQ